MRRGARSVLGGIGLLLIVLGWLVVLGLGGYVTYLAYRLAFSEGHVGKGVALEFVAAPITLALIHTCFGLAAWPFITLAERLDPARESEDDDGLDPITRRALASDPEVRRIWQREE
jgi:hypothetical protein